MKLERLKKLPKLPGFRTSEFREVVLEQARYERVVVQEEKWERDDEGREQIVQDELWGDGEKIHDAVVVKLYKAKSSDSIPVSARMLALIGPEMYQLLSHSDEDDPDNPLSGLLDVDIDDPAQLKTAISTFVLPLLKAKLADVADGSGPGSMRWFFERLIGAYVEYDGHRSRSLADLDEMGFSIGHLARLFWSAVELNLFPSRGARGTSPGSKSQPPAPEDQADTDPPPSSSNTTGESHIETGRSVRMSRTAG